MKIRDFSDLELESEAVSPRRATAANSQFSLVVYSWHPGVGSSSGLVPLAFAHITSARFGLADARPNLANWRPLAAIARLGRN